MPPGCASFNGFLELPLRFVAVAEDDDSAKALIFQSPLSPWLVTYAVEKSDVTPTRTGDCQPTVLPNTCTTLSLVPVEKFITDWVPKIVTLLLVVFGTYPMN